MKWEDSLASLSHKRLDSTSSEIGFVDSYFPICLCSFLYTEEQSDRACIFAFADQSANALSNLWICFCYGWAPRLQKKRYLEAPQPQFCSSTWACVELPKREVGAKEREVVSSELQRLCVHLIETRKWAPRQPNSCIPLLRCSPTLSIAHVWSQQSSEVWHFIIIERVS